MKISVIVTNWNGVSLLKKYLHNVIINSPEASEILLADDASTDESLVFAKTLQKKYPKLKIISHPDNLGFSRNSNDAVNSAKGDYVVLLNSDIDPQPGYISQAIKHFDKDVLGVGFCEIGHENYAKIKFSGGYLQHEPQYSSHIHISGWLSGGSSIINKKIFQKLGGFDPVYEPFYSEDLDLGYRAWKSGYRCLWDPKAKIYHKHESTTSKFPKRLLNYVKERNRLINVLRLIDNPHFLQQNKLALIGRVLTGPNYLKIIRAAKKQISKYPKPIIFPKLTDQQIFQLFQ